MGPSIKSGIIGEREGYDILVDRKRLSWTSSI